MMEFLFSILAPTLFLAVLVIIVVVVVGASRRTNEDENEEEQGIGTLRRVFYYLLGFAALGVSVSGLTLLLSTLIDPLFGDRILVAGTNRLAMALAMSLVGFPIWFFLWSRSQKLARDHPVEARTLGRKFYLYLILGVSSATAATSSVALLQWAFRVEDSASVPVSLLLVMAVVWLYHRRADTASGAGREADLMPRIYIYLTALYALVMLAAGAGTVLYLFLLEAYDKLVQSPILGPSLSHLWGRGVRESLSVAIVGGLWWWAHWKVLARADRDPRLRQVYLYVFAVFGGAITVVISAATLLHGVLDWLIRAPGADIAAEHFRMVPGALAGLVIGGALWGYHHAVIKEESPGTEARFIAGHRAYQYMISAVGLGTLAVGLVLAFGSTIGLFIPSGPTLVASGAWRPLLTLAITLIAVGAPLWGLVWARLERDAAAAPQEERNRTSRRVFIYAVFGIALLITLGNMSALLFVLLKDLMQGNFGLQSIQDGRWSTASLLMAGAISVYYGYILREDRHFTEVLVEATPVQGRKRVTAIARSSVVDLLKQQVETSLGYPVTWWRTMDGDTRVPAINDAELSALGQQIADAQESRVLIIIDGSGLRVVPYQTR